MVGTGESHADSASVVVSALAASGGREQDTEVAWARAKLLDLVRRRLDGQSSVLELLENFDKPPHGWRTALGLALSDTGVDEGMMAATALLMDLINAAGSDNSVRIVFTRVQGLQVGENNTQYNTYLPSPPPTPRELPPDTYGFTGRSGELAELDNLLSQATNQPALVLISAVSGTAGVGKTALAVHWAHRTRLGSSDPFPDGCLYIDLRGYDVEDPLDPA